MSQRAAVSSPRTNIKCPTCGAPTSYFSEPTGPFCSARCQMIDLGKWLGEEYRITEPLRPEHFAQFEDLAEGQNLDTPESEG